METLTLNQVLSLVSAVHLIPVFTQLRAWGLEPKVYFVGGLILQIRVHVGDLCDDTYGDELRSVVLDYLNDNNFHLWGKSTTVWTVSFGIDFNEKSNDIKPLLSLYNCNSIDELRAICVGLRNVRNTVFKPRSFRLDTDRMVFAFLVHAFRILVGDSQFINSTLAVTSVKPGDYPIESRAKHEQITLQTYTHQTVDTDTTKAPKAIYTDVEQEFFSGDCATKVTLRSMTYWAPADWKNNIACSF